MSHLVYRVLAGVAAANCLFLVYVLLDVYHIERKIGREMAASAMILLSATVAACGVAFAVLAWRTP